ncbi:cytidine deaminase [Salirhabdus salicampi]|uniref:cytidine deaminase n=1 Tax=Salirhabdus salicampi TaxID=476102 RepID=UPI0020C2A353|nr:cytidine deaminase [Salirhabdus salicampi]MCP8616659.1 cytidine deaminase [Salirhabdus salicampi]
MSKELLLSKAKEARKRAYVPYSTFHVGAALQTKNGNIYLGCNIENAAYPVTCCAERVAIFKAISEGETEFVEMAVVADTERPVPPCGSCRQVMSEFFAQTMTVHISNLQGEVKTMSVEQLLPFSFSSQDLSDRDGKVSE